MYSEDLITDIINNLKEWRKDFYRLNPEIYEVLTSAIDILKKYQKDPYEVIPDDPEIPEPKTK